MQQKTRYASSDWVRGVGKALCDVPTDVCSLCARCFALTCRVPLYIQTSHGPRAQGMRVWGECLCPPTLCAQLLSVSL